MKAIHYGIIIGGILTGIFFYLYIRTGELSQQRVIRQEYGQALDSAVDSAFSQVSLRDGKANAADKNQILTNFFDTWYDQIQQSYDQEERTRNQVYVPCLALTERDGISIYCLQKTNTGYSGAWLPKVRYTFQYDPFLLSPYYTIFVTQDYRMTIQCYDQHSNHVIYEISGDYHEIKGAVDSGMDFIIRNADFLDNETAFQRKIDTLINDKLKEEITYSITEHKKNAEQAYDINIDFAIPQISESEWDIMSHNISLLVIYQGYPNRKSNTYIEDYSFSCYY
jgi:hypothetical protein